MNSIQEVCKKYINATNQNIFLTGKAGTGKTTLLRELINYTHKNTAVAAPTGIAAINAKGVTLHSLFQIPFGYYLPIQDFDMASFTNNRQNTAGTLPKSLKIRNQKREVIRSLELLIIDEVSMLRCDTLDCINQILQIVRRNNQPFGGVQVLFIGDLLQLPPVVNDTEWQALSAYYDSPFFFDAHAIRQAPLKYIELDKVYRQSDETFVNLLNNLRNNIIEQKDIELLNSRQLQDDEAEEVSDYVYITTHNRYADAKNKSELNKLSTKEHILEAKVEGDFHVNHYPTDEKLLLKTGARVMFMVNDTSEDKQYFNGKLATIKSIGIDNIKVNDDHGTEIEVLPYSWENTRYEVDNTGESMERNVIGTFTQYPLRLAWAITIHKSQGLTFEKAVLDVAKVFAPGQLYVALSRLTSLEGLRLASPVSQQLIPSDKHINTFAQKREPKDRLVEKFEEHNRQYLYDLATGSFNFDLTTNIIFREFEGIDDKKTTSVEVKKVVSELREAFSEMKKIAHRFERQLKAGYDTNNDSFVPYLNERAAKASTYFLDILGKQKAAVRTLIKKLNNAEGTYKQLTKQLREVVSLVEQHENKIRKARHIISCSNEGKEISKLSFEPREKVLPTKKPTSTKKGDSHKFSYDLYKGGKTVAEIAQERSLTESTIFNHLIKYVESGEIAALTLIDIKTLEKLLPEVRKLSEEHTMRAIYDTFGGQVSYQDIKVAKAYMGLENRK